MTITYLEAIREAQEKALRDDQRVYIYGQDVGAFGGAFKATKNLAKEFPGRILDAPISEDAMIGSAIGAAIEGMRPIVEMQFTIRLPSGGNPGSGPFHSQCLEALYSHFPGLVVMTPATVEDAYTMLLEAVEIDDPVIFCEHKYLYNRLKADSLPETNLPYDTARIARFGRDVTIVSYSAMVHDALAAADQLRKEGIEVEVVDLRCVKPFDLQTVLGSVARTARLLCVGESWPWGGVNSEVITSVVTHGFHLLDAPPQRINSKDTPIPFHPNLWAAHKPSSQVIATAARRLCEW